MDKLHLVTVLDMSGSMATTTKETLEGYNQYIKDLNTQNVQVFVTLVVFNSMNPTGRAVYTARPISEVPELTIHDYAPNGFTPLYDAIGATIDLVSREMKEDKTPVLFLTITDGEENTSRIWTKARIKDRYTEKESQGWTFAYIGANQDVWVEGGAIGTQVGNTKAYSADSYGTRVMYSSLRDNTNAYIGTISGQSNPYAVADFFNGSDNVTGNTGPTTSTKAKSKRGKKGAPSL